MQDLCNIRQATALDDRSTALDGRSKFGIGEVAQNRQVSTYRLLTNQPSDFIHQSHPSLLVNYAWTIFHPQVALDSLKPHMTTWSDIKSKSVLTGIFEFPNIPDWTKQQPTDIVKHLALRCLSRCYPNDVRTSKYVSHDSTMTGREAWLRGISKLNTMS